MTAAASMLDSRGSATQHQTAIDADWLARTGLLPHVLHELRTPVNGVLGFAQILRAAGNDISAVDRDRWLALIEMSAQHLAAMVEDLVVFPRVSTGSLALHVSSVAVPASVDEAVAMILPSANSGQIELVVDLGDPMACVMADRLRLRQILLNLLSNAVKYNRSRGTVHVSWTLGHGGDTVLLAVRDSGAGLRADQVSHLFEPFNRLGAERSGVDGLGLGLAIARGLARLMQGDIRVASEIDRGSTFTLELPTQSH